jgi:hypothetical protein
MVQGLESLNKMVIPFGKSMFFQNNKVLIEVIGRLKRRNMMPFDLLSAHSVVA